MGVEVFDGAKARQRLPLSELNIRCTTQLSDCEASELALLRAELEASEIKRKQVCNQMKTAAYKCMYFRVCIGMFDRI